MGGLLAGTARRDWLISNLKSSLKVDSYVDFEYPEGHALYWEGVYQRAYWMKQYGYDRVASENLKGIVVLVYMP